MKPNRREAKPAEPIWPPAFMLTQRKNTEESDNSPAQRKPTDNDDEES